MFRNRKISDLKEFHNDEVTSWMNPALDVRQSVNQKIGRLNTKQWNVIIEANSEDFILLQVPYFHILCF